MEREKINFTDPQLFAISAGLLIMVAPCFYWLGILSATLFEKGFIVKTFLLSGSPGESMGDMFVLIALPIVALLINIRSRLGERTRKRSINLVQLSLMFISGLCLVGAFTHSFFSRLHIFNILYS